ncbi:MAG: carbohydrate kinase family protein [Promethearchaeota archaeon]
MANEEIDIACIGSCCVDVIMHVNDVLRFELIDPKQEEIKKYTAIEYSSKLNVNNVKFAPGGSAANVSSNLSGLGLKTAYIGKLGDDFLAKMAMDDMRDAGVNLESCFLTDEDATGTSIVLITPFGKDRSILSYKGANNLIKPDEIKDDFLKKAKNLQWTSLTSDSGIKSIKKCIDIVKSNGGTVFACPSISILRNNLDGAKNLIKHSDVLILNKEELFTLTGLNEILHAIQHALDMGPSIVACTNGGEGSKISDGKTLVSADVYKIDVTDTTGAGDAFASGLIYAYLNGKGLEDMIKYGSAISAFECSVLGVRDGIPRDIKAVEDFIKNHQIHMVKTSFHV